MERIAQFILRRRAPLLWVVAGVTIWFATYLVPPSKIRTDFSFQRLFVQYGGDWGTLRDMVRDFGADVSLTAVLVVAPEGEGPLSGTVLHPAVLRGMMRIQDDLAAREEVPRGGVDGLLSVPDLYSDPVAIDFVRSALSRYDEALKRAGATDAAAVACLERRIGCAELPADLRAATGALVKLGPRLLAHGIYVRRLVSPDLSAAMIAARYGVRYRNEDLRRPMIDWLRVRIHAWRESMPDGARVAATGVPIIEVIYNEASRGDMKLFTPLVTGIIGLLLMALFRWFWAMFVPLLAVQIGVVWGLGLMQATGEPINILNNVTPIVILVVGVADAVHYVMRYLQEYRRLRDRHAALVETVRALGWACLLTSATTAVGFGSLVSASIPTIKSFGIYVALAVMLEYVVILIVVPALLSYVKPPPERVLRAAAGGRFDRAMTWIGHATIRRRWRVLLVAALVAGATAVAVLGVPGTGYEGVRNESRLLEEVQPTHPVYRTTHEVQDRLSGLLVHALYIRGREIPGSACRSDEDCADPSCDPRACAFPDCCRTRVCKRYNLFHHFTSRIRRVVDLLTSMDSPGALTALEERATELVARAAAQAGGGGPGAGDDGDELLLEEEEEEGADPAGDPAGDSSIVGVCAHSVLNLGLLRRLDRFSRKVLADPRHRGFVTRIDDLASLVREMGGAIRGDPSWRDGPDFPLAGRDELAQILLALSQDGATLLDRVRTPDRTRTQVSFVVSDMGTRAWKRLRRDLRAFIQEFKADPALGSNYSIAISGSSSLAQDAISRVVSDLVSSLALAFVSIFLLMSALFRSFRIGLVSMVPNLLPLAITLGIMGLFGIPIRTATAVIFSISLGIAVDDTIHLLERFREEYGRDQDLEAALVRALRGSGRAVLLTTVILVCGFAVTVLSDFVAMEQFGYLSACTLASAFVADVVLLPALISTFRLDRKLHLKGGASKGLRGREVATPAPGEGLR